MAILSSMPSIAVCGEGGGKSGVGGWVYPVGVKGIPSLCFVLSNCKDPGGLVATKEKKVIVQILNDTRYYYNMKKKKFTGYFITYKLLTRTKVSSAEFFNFT